MLYAGLWGRLFAPHILTGNTVGHVLCQQAGWALVVSVLEAILFWSCVAGHLHPVSRRG